MSLYDILIHQYCRANAGTLSFDIGSFSTISGLISGGKKKWIWSVLISGNDIVYDIVGFFLDIVVLTFDIEEWQEGCFKSVLMSENDIEGVSFDIERKTYDIVHDIVTRYRRIARRAT